MKKGWSREKLKDVCQIRPPKKEVKDKLSETELVSFVPMNMLGIEEKFFNSKVNKALSEVSGSYTYFQEGDVILAKITPCFENGKLGIAKGLTNGIGFGSSEFIVYRSLKSLNNEYLYYYLNQEGFRIKGKTKMTGAVGHKRIPKSFYEDSEIPIPPLKEQQQIVSILDQAFAAIDKAKANIEKNIQNAKELFQSKLNEVFSQKGEGWEYKSLKDVSNIINGYSFKSTDFSPDNEVKSIKITNVGIMEFVEDSSNNLPFNFLSEYSKSKVHKGDLVLALTRTIISGGLKVARVPENYHNSLLNQRVAAIIPDSSLIDSDYLYYYFSSDLVYNYVLENVNTLMQPNLSIGDLKAMLVPVTSIKGQRKISHQIESLFKKNDSIIDNYKVKHKNLEELKKSVLQKAFAGELNEKVSVQ